MAKETCGSISGPSGDCPSSRRGCSRPTGGRGGEVILEADHDLNNLIAQYYTPRLIAEDGKAGMGKGMDGRAGKDLIIKVPCGTLVWKLPEEPQGDEEAPEDDADEGPAALPISTRQRPVLPTTRKLPKEEEKVDQARAVHASDGAELIADLTDNGSRWVLCKGGRGGLGNRNFATARRQTPRFAQPGESGEAGQFRLELRMVADVGLVGYPNAGKSTLLSAISKARPKIAPYPFTTLHPQVGIVEYPDHHRLTICDVPGLIEGAHQNVGLGHAFLRHIQRCKILVLLLDMAGTDGRLPWDDYSQLLRELELYDPSLLQRPRLVFANKIDEEAATENIKKFRKRIRGVRLHPMAAGFGEGVEEFKDQIRKAVEAATAPVE